MKLFDFFTRKKDERIAITSENILEEVATYIAAEATEYEFVSVIATAFAASEQADSQFVVRRILKRNPEAELITLIAASIAAGDEFASRFVIKRISREK